MPLLAYTAADVVVSERKRLERPLMLLVWLSVVVFGLAEGNAWCILAGTVVAGVKLAGVQLGKEIYLRRLLVNAGVLLATAATLLDLLVGLRDPLTGLAHYVILILLCKVFERCANRDYAQILALCMLIMVASAIFCEQLWFAVLLAVQLCLLCYVAMVLALKRGLDAAAASRLRGEAAPMAPHRVAWNVRRDWPAGALRRRGAVVLAAMLLTGVGTFLIAPRVRSLPGAIAGESAEQKNSSNGSFSGTVTLGDAKTIVLRDNLVMQLEVQTNPPGGTWSGYLRGQVFAEYHDSSWSRTGFRGDSSPMAGLPEPNAPAPPGMVLQKVHMVSSLLPVLFAAAPAAWVEVAADQRGPGMNAAGELRLNDRTARNRWVDYTVCSYNQAISLPSAPPHRGNIVVQPAVRELARQWCSDLLDQRAKSPAKRDELDLAIARRLADRLREGYRYSLDLSKCNPQRDGVEDFLFYMKQGHCEYFASALTSMCHAMGVQAHLAGGFLVDLHSGKDRYEVAERDAHAWTEVYTPTSGWVIVDATPGGVPQAVAKPWWMPLASMWEELHQSWQQNVINYDDRARRHVMAHIQAVWLSVRDAGAWVGQVLSRGLESLLSGRLDGAVIWMAALLGLASAGTQGVLLARRVRRRRGTLKDLRRRLGPSWRRVSFLGAFFRALHRRGLPLTPTQTPQELAARAHRELGLPTGDLDDVIRFYYRLRWGDAALDAAPLDAARQAVARLCAMMRKRPIVH